MALLTALGRPEFVGTLLLSLLLYEGVDRCLSPRGRVPLLVAGAGALALTGGPVNGLRALASVWPIAWLLWVAQAPRGPELVAWRVRLEPHFLLLSVCLTIALSGNAFSWVSHGWP